MSNQFYFGTPDDTDSDLFDNDDTLPFPKPLERSAFLAPDFVPATFLSSLSDRFQTLEDLQNELRELAQSLNKELIDLVNNNYQDFLSLGSTLAGGEEKIEDVRVGLLGFQRDVNSVREKVVSRRNEISNLLDQKREIRKNINKGINLINIAERLDDLERQLEITQPHKRDEQTREDDTDDLIDLEGSWKDDLDQDQTEIDESSSIPKRLIDLVQKYRIIQTLRKRENLSQPFIGSQAGRLQKILDTLHRDLDLAIRQEGEVRTKQKIIQLKTSLDD